MEWGNAKKFVIVLLVLLNLVLAGLNYRQNQEATMTAAQERAIFEVLSQNGIIMYTDILTDSAPMARLSAEIPSYSKETLERLFFGSKKTTVAVRGEQTVYRGEGAVLTVSGGYGLWKKDDVADGKEGLHKADAQKAAEDFLMGTEHFFGSYEEPLVLEWEEGYEVRFYGLYKREKVFSNYFSVLVTKGGIKQIEYHYCPIQGYSDEERDICYSDEALLTFMREWKKSGKEGEATIHRIELGYEQMEGGNTAETDTIELEPCYRIYLMEEDEPYLINAYTCQMVK